MKQRAIYLCLIIAILQLLLSSALADSKKNINLNTQQQQFDQYFQQETKVPAGFASLAKKQKTSIDVFFANQYVGLFQAYVSPDSISFIHPENIIAKLPSIKDKALLTTTLKGKLPTNSSKICNPYKQRPCGMITPKIAGVIYNANQYRAYLFINPSLLSLHRAKPGIYIPNSTSNFSYVNELNGFTSNADGINPVNNYSLTSDNVVSYKNARLNVSTTIGNDLLGEDGVEINEANVELDNKQYQYTAGLIQTLGNYFFANQTIIGAGFKTTLNTLTDSSRDSGTPINVFLNFPSQVSVFKDGKLIYSRQLPAGNQQINTRNFPEGAYPVTIRIINEQGASKTQQRFFVKSNDLAPLHKPQFYAYAGELMAYRQFNSGALTELLPIPVLQTGLRYRFTPTLGGDVGLLANDKSAYTSVGLTYISHYLTINPSLLLGTDGSFGYSLATEGQYHSLYANFDISQIKHGRQANNINTNPFTGTSNTNPDSYYVRFISLNTLQLNSSISYTFNRGNITFNANVNQSQLQPTTYSYGPSFMYNFYRKGPVYFYINLSANKTEYDASVLATLSINFTHNRFSGNGSLGYTHQSNNDVNSLNGNGLDAAATLNYNHFDATNNGYNVNVTANTSPTVKNVGMNYDYRNNYLSLNTYGSYNDNNDTGSFAQYGGSFDTRIVYAPGTVGIGGGTIGSNTGIIVNVSSKDRHARFNIYVDKHLTKTVGADQRIFIDLEPYETYHITIQNASKHLYFIKDKDKTVTLYPGNAQYLHWTASSQIVISGQIVDTQGKPLVNKLIHAGEGFNTTDTQGYFQVSVDTLTRKLKVDGDKGVCYVKIPKLPANKDYEYLGKATCQS